MAKIELNALDRVITAISPTWGMERMKARAAMAISGGYFGGSKGRRAALSNWNPGAGDATADISRDLPDLRSLTRDLARTSPLGGGAINTVVTNVVGTGMSMRATPDAKFLGLSDDQAEEWGDNVEREWRSWAETIDCDITRTQNFYGLQSLAFRSALESGDVITLLPSLARNNGQYGLALQLIEADRLLNENFGADNRNRVAGVVLDDNGTPTEYQIADQHPGSLYRTGITWTKVPAFGEQTGRRNVLHLFDKRRPGQARGVPYLAPVIEPLKQLNRYSEAEISAAVISAAFAVFIKMDPEAFSDMLTDDARTTYINTASKWDGSLNTANMDQPGKVTNLLPGEDVLAPDLKRPNVAFDPFVQAVLRQVGVGLELPFEVLIKHFTASYSAARAALLDAWRFFRGRRDFLATYFCQPIYETWLEEAVASGRISAPGFFASPVYRHAWCRAVWTGDGPGSIDPLKEVQAAEARIDLCLSTTDAESLAYDGVGFEAKLKQRSKEKRLMDAAGLTATAPAPSPDGQDFPSDPPKVPPPDGVVPLSPANAHDEQGN